MSDWPGAMVHAEERSASYSGSRKCYLVRAGQPGHRLWPVIPIPSPASVVIRPEGLEGTSLPISV